MKWKAYKYIAVVVVVVMFVLMGTLAVIIPMPAANDSGTR